MEIIKKKIWPEYFEAVGSGKKNFEVRLADFDVNEGDTLLLEEWDPGTKEYTGRSVEKQVTYVAKTKSFAFYQPEEVEKYGYQVIGLK